MDSSASGEQPVVYVLHGDDPLAIQREVNTLVSRMGDPTLAEMNITHLDGRSAGEDIILASANAMPFMTERRMVILDHPFARAANDAARKRFLALLDGLPPSTAMVLIVADVVDRGDWKSLPKKRPNWIMRWLEGAGHRAKYQLCALPTMKEMPEWVRKETRRLKGQITPEAATALAAHIGNDTQQASLEIEKLLNYVDGKRPVEIEDVEEMTAQGGQDDVFDMVDAMAGGNTRQAVAVLHQLLETQEPLSLFGMIVRQFRLLLQARELIDEGRGSLIASEMHLIPFVADKLANQARRFSMPQLEDIYHRLLLLDETIKTSQAPGDLALDTFIATLSR